MDKIGKIYKMYNTNSDMVYYGSTSCKYLSKRLGNHKSDYKKFCKGERSNITSFQLYDVEGEVKIELVEIVKYTDKEELRKRERFYIENFDCINKQIPNRTKQEYQKTFGYENDKKYREKNKEKLKLKKKEYYEKNKERILLHNKIHREKKKLSLIT